MTVPPEGSMPAPAREGGSARELRHEPIPPGTVLLDRYRVLHQLGVGGMSLVVCAEHVSSGSKVAMKFLLPELATLPDAPDRFAREAKAATRVNSEHVSKVLDVGVLPDGPPYMILEYFEGRDLGKYVREGKRFAVGEAIELVVQAADALSHAHAAGVIHRDVKPSNLFLTQRPDGSPLVKVLDFGISKLVEEAAKENLELTKTTAVMGSALYMSLEQMRSTKTVDHRTDIYALGVTLYELLSGTHPFTADSFSELCVKVSLDPPAPLRDHRPDLPESLAETIEIAYARNAAERYQTAGSFAAALAPFAEQRTLERIDAIRRFERASFPDGKIPERQMTPLALRATDAQRPPRLEWVRYTLAAGAGLALAGALWVLLPPKDDPHAGVPTPSAAPPGPDAAPPSTGTTSGPVVPATASDAGASSAGTSKGDASVTGTSAVDAGKSGKPSRPCKRGETIVLPNGLKKPCGL